MAMSEPPARTTSAWADGTARDTSRHATPSARRKVLCVIYSLIHDRLSGTRVCVAR